MGYGQSVRSQIDSINRNSATLMKLRFNSERTYWPITPPARWRAACVCGDRSHFVWSSRL